MGASGDGSKIFFTDEAASGLTGDTSPGSGTNLYEYDVSGGTLIDLTQAAEVNVLGVVGVDRNGGYVYFVATGDLASGATAGQPNMYVWHEGTVAFIATLDGEKSPSENGDSQDWLHQSNARWTVKLTPDGIHLAFDSDMSLTGYDNRDASTGERDDEVYLYDTATRRLICASCNPTGTRPIGPSRLSPPEDYERDALAGAVPVTTYDQRNLSRDGTRLFFNSFDALAPQDANGRQDVYEYESGQLHLISGGTSGEDSVFLDASANGSDVFFRTAQRLVSQDDDQQLDVYDARVGGGFPPSSSPLPCAGEDCRPTPAAPPGLGSPTSATFEGIGNLAPSLENPALTSKPKAKTKKKVKAKRRRKRRGRAVKGARSVHGSGMGHSIGKRG